METLHIGFCSALCCVCITVLAHDTEIQASVFLAPGSSLSMSHSQELTCWQKISLCWNSQSHGHQHFWLYLWTQLVPEFVLVAVYTSTSGNRHHPLCGYSYIVALPPILSHSMGVCWTSLPSVPPVCTTVKVNQVNFLTLALDSCRLLIAGIYKCWSYNILPSTNDRFINVVTL